MDQEALDEARYYFEDVRNNVIKTLGPMRHEERYDRMLVISPKGLCVGTCDKPLPAHNPDVKSWAITSDDGQTITLGFAVLQGWEDPAGYQPLSEPFRMRWPSDA